MHCERRSFTLYAARSVSRRTPPAVELVGHPDQTAAGLTAQLAAHLHIAVGPTHRTDRVVMDTFDALARAAGLTIERRDRPGRPSVLDVRKDGRLTGAIEIRPEHRHRIRADELPDGPVADTVLGSIGVRALLPRARLVSRVRAVAVLDEEGKTVVRIEVEEPTARRRGGDDLELAPRIRATALLGYERSLDPVLATLRDKLGWQDAQSSLHDEALTALREPPAGYPAKSRVELEPDMPSREAILTLCRVLAETIDDNLPGTLSDLDTEFLHDLRVSVRRTRSLLKTAKGVLPPDVLAQAGADLRWVQEITGPTRDLDVQLLELRELTGQLRELAVDVGPLHDVLARRRAKAFKQLRRHLTGQPFSEVRRRWRAVLDEWRPPEPGGERGADRAVVDFAAERAQRLYRQVVREGQAVSADSPPTMLHDLRKRCKELRYSVEHFGTLWPADEIKPLVRSLKGLQDVLGRFQDREVQIAQLRSTSEEVATAEGGVHALLAVGAIIDRLATDKELARDEFTAAFSAFASKSQRQRVKGTFTAPRRSAAQ